MLEAQSLGSDQQEVDECLRVLRRESRARFARNNRREESSLRLFVGNF
jgi:hypothetical protein